jgi:hypothetical protein
MRALKASTAGRGCSRPLAAGPHHQDVRPAQSLPYRRASPLKIPVKQGCGAARARSPLPLHNAWNSPRQLPSLNVPTGAAACGIALRWLFTDRFSCGCMRPSGFRPAPRLRQGAGYLGAAPSALRACFGAAPQNFLPMPFALWNQRPPAAPVELWALEIGLAAALFAAALSFCALSLFATLRAPAGNYRPVMTDELCKRRRGSCRPPKPAGAAPCSAPGPATPRRPQPPPTPRCSHPTQPAPPGLATAPGVPCRNLRPRLPRTP